MALRLAEFVQFRAPAGFSETIGALAEREGVSASEFMRRAILADINCRGTGVELAAEDEPEKHKRKARAA